jgi:putative membrane protein
MSLLSEGDAARVRNAVAAVESATSGELVVVLAPQSDNYALPRAVVALALTVSAGFGVYQAWPHHPAGWVFAGQAALWGLIWWAVGWAPVLRTLVPKAQQSAAVESRAKQLFLDCGVTETRDRSGVLIFLSEAEHRVQIIADRGLSEQVNSDAWQKYVAAIVTAIQSGRAADGLCAAIDDIGQMLAEAFPPRADDVNELPDELVRVP